MEKVSKFGIHITVCRGLNTSFNLLNLYVIPLSESTSGLKLRARKTVLRYKISLGRKHFYQNSAASQTNNVRIITNTLRLANEKELEKNYNKYILADSTQTPPHCARKTPKLSSPCRKTQNRSHPKQYLSRYQKRRSPTPDLFHVTAKCPTKILPVFGILLPLSVNTTRPNLSTPLLLEQIPHLFFPLFIKNTQTPSFSPSAHKHKFLIHSEPIKQQWRKYILQKKSTNQPQDGPIFDGCQ